MSLLKRVPLPMLNHQVARIDFTSFTPYLSYLSQQIQMAYNTKLAHRIRTYLAEMPNIKVEEKEMFSGLAFLVNGKMCINVSDDNLMCRFDPEFGFEVCERIGYQPMIMKGRQLKGYCYVSEDGYKSRSDFEYWLTLCLDFNDKAKASKKKKTSTKKRSRT